MTNSKKAFIAYYFFQLGMQALFTLSYYFQWKENSFDPETFKMMLGIDVLCVFLPILYIINYDK